MAPIAQDADVLVHEATNAWSPLAGKSPDQVERETFSHGHSTPQMAGALAKTINAKRLVLTHFSPRYTGEPSEQAMRSMWAIEDMARLTSELKEDNEVIAAWDLMSLGIPTQQ